MINNKDLFQIVVPAGAFLCLLFGYFLLNNPKRQRIEQRMARVTKRKVAQKIGSAMTLRKTKESGLPFIGKFIQSVTSMNGLRERIERAGLKIAPDMFAGCCAGAALVITVVLVLAHKPVAIAIAAGIVLGGFAPYIYIGMKGAKRLKKFLTLFPDAIDFIVRGLRSGLPATESMNLVGTEMQEPIGSIFSGIGESVKLGITVEKALSDTAKKLNLTEFNFFVTSIILQRETGGNLSEILSNLSDVLRKRFMMRMKIKAMSSEAKASAIIVGSLPFVVILALTFVSPGYLDPLVDDPKGHIASGVAAAMMLSGIGIMVKMTRFEI